MQNAADERDLENKLMLLLGHEKFSIIKKLRKNRMKGEAFQDIEVWSRGGLEKFYGPSTV